MPRVAIIGIDNFDRKNSVQLRGLNGRGFVYDVLTADRLGDSAANFPEDNTLEILKPGFFSRTLQLIKYLRSNRRQITHVEVYPGGRYAGMIALLTKAYGLPLMTVERGDLQYLDRIDAVTRLAMRICYRLSDVVWYRQFLEGGQGSQEQRLRQLGAKHTFFLPNAVEVPSRTPDSSARHIDFIWVNSFIAERRADWFVDVLSSARFTGTRAVLSGFKTPATPRVAEQQAYIAANCPANVEIRPWSDPKDLYATGRFFVLPSLTVYCNNSLLEAMAFGVVPIVSNVSGTSLIVEDGVNGIVFEHTPRGLQSALEKALSLSVSDHERLSRNAVNKVRRDFAVDRWIDALETEYCKLAGYRRTMPFVRR